MGLTAASGRPSLQRLGEPPAPRRWLGLRGTRGQPQPDGGAKTSEAGAIFVYVPHLRTGGGEQSMLRLAQGFAAAGRRVCLVVHTLRTQELAVPAGVPVLELARDGTSAALRQLVRVLRQRRPQWLLSAFPHTNVSAVVAARLARSGTRCVVTEHAPLSLLIAQQASRPGGWRYRVLPPLVRWAYPRAAAVVAVSQGVRDDLLRQLPRCRAPLVIHNPVLAPDFDAELALPPDHPWLLDPALQVVLSVCRLADEKDLPTLLRAFAEVHRERPETRLLLAGDGPERDRLQALVAALGLQAVVQLPGRTAQPLRWMQRAAVFVLPSRFEGFGNALVEALACGTPVVATDCPVGPREVLDGGRHGALVPVGDAAAMARGIAAALQERTQPAGAREAARRHTQQAACAGYLRLFDDPAHRPAPSSPLLRGLLGFLPAQLLSPAAQLVSILLWTHWLPPAQMAVFTLVAVAQEMAYAVCLAWFSVYALRYVPPPADRPAVQRYLGTENAVVLASVAASLVAGLLVLATLPGSAQPWHGALTIGLYFATRGINAHYAERARAQSAFLAYTLLQTSGPLGAIGLGLLAFRYTTPDAFVLLGAYTVAQLLGALAALPLLQMRWRLVRPDRATVSAAVAFGGPVLGLAVLGWLAENYLRYLVQWQAGAATLGLMVVGWSLGRRCAAVATMLVATAAFPLAARLLNEGRRAEALAQMRVNAGLVLAVLAPVVAAMAFLGPSLVSLTVGPAYRQLTAELLGLAVLGGALRNLHAHVSDQLMVLDRRLAMLAWVTVFELVACAAASLAGLLQWGLPGALAGQALGSLLTLALSLHWAQRHLGLAWPWGASWRILLATAAMAAALDWLQVRPGLHGLLVGTLVGAAVYAVVLALLFARPPPKPHRA